MVKYLKCALIVVLLSITSETKALHLIGGYFSYECLGPVAGTNEVEYVLRAVLFKDSTNNLNAAVLENPLTVTLFGPAPGYNLIRTIDLQRDSLTTKVDSGVGLCVIGAPTVTIILTGYYSDTVRLRNDQEHTFAWRRCCRNNPSNVLNSSTSGSSFFIDIPRFDQQGCNSSPQLVADQPFSFCTGVDIDLDLSATDADGDSLVYELCAPFDFPRPGGVGPTTQVPANPPPYNQISFLTPATATNPIPSSPAITIDPVTGRLTGTPTRGGKYLIGFCIKEFNSNGVLLSTTIRDIQVQINDCILQVTSAIQDQERFCDGLTIQFRNRTSSNVDSTTINYKWDFGVPSQTNDTSRRFEPLPFTYPAPGFYNITLIANPDKPQCRDTTITLFEVRPQLQSTINSVETNLCNDNNQVNFSVGGIFQSNATFLWNFGTTASIPSSTNQAVSNVVFPSTGIYPIQLITSQDNCTDTSNVTINVFDNPSGDFTFDDPTGCAPHDVLFNATITDLGANGSPGIYKWNFGDGSGTVSTTNSTISHQYLNDGTFPVTLTYESTGDCIDTIVINKPNLIQIGTQFSTNNTDFTASPQAGCFPLEVDFTNLSTFDGTATYLWDFGDGSPTSSAENPKHTYTANGLFNVTLTMTTSGQCAQVLSKVIDNPIDVSLDSSKNTVDFTVSQDTGCTPVDVQFTNTSFTEGNANYTWFFGDGETSTDPNPLHTYQTDGIFDVQLILESTQKCVETIDTIKPAFIETDVRFSTNEVDFDFFPKEGCPPLTVQFSDSSTFLGTPQYFWDFGDGSDPNFDQNPTYQFTDTGEYSVGLLLITSDKCVDTIRTSSSEKVKVLPKPVAQINSTDSAKSLKEALFQFNNSGSQFVNRSKYVINGEVVGTTDILNYQFSDTGHFTVSYVAVNSLNCEDTATAEVFVFDEFQFVIPNVFTPNGDFINDEFKMQACGVYDYEIQIFSRLGEKVFESNSLSINWDGTKKGKPLTSGTYYYVIKIRQFENKLLDYKGSVTLLKD